jgi:hypothetical protein
MNTHLPSAKKAFDSYIAVSRKTGIVSHPTQSEVKNYLASSDVRLHKTYNGDGTVTQHCKVLVVRNGKEYSFKELGA